MVAPLRPSRLERGRRSSPQASGERGLQGVENACQHPLFILENVGLAKADARKSLRRQMNLAAGLCGTLCMLCAIALDNETTAQAKKIANVMIDSKLPLEPISSERL